MAEFRIASYLGGLCWAGSFERLTIKSAHETDDHYFQLYPIMLARPFYILQWPLRYFLNSYDDLGPEDLRVASVLVVGTNFYRRNKTADNCIVRENYKM
jgi:hypothetical protein